MGNINEDNWRETPEHNDTIKHEGKLGHREHMRNENTTDVHDCDNINWSKPFFTLICLVKCKFLTLHVSSPDKAIPKYTVVSSKNYENM